MTKPLCSRVWQWRGRSCRWDRPSPRSTEIDEARLQQFPLRKVESCLVLWVPLLIRTCFWHFLVFWYFFSYFVSNLMCGKHFYSQHVIIIYIITRARIFMLKYAQKYAFKNPKKYRIIINFDQRNIKICLNMRSGLCLDKRIYTICIQRAFAWLS